jgi:hypothetical protein
VLKISDAIAGWTPPAQNAARDSLALLEAGWEEIVGREVARHSCPARIAGETLTIATRSSAWSHQLSFLGEHVLQAVAARLPETKIKALRFRVGRIVARRAAVSPPHRARTGKVRDDRPETQSPVQALARFRKEVEERRRARLAEGWKECLGCGAIVAPAAAELCSACAAAKARERAAATARLLLEAPWLGYGGTANLVEGLYEAEYEQIRTGLLRHWWEVLARARDAKRLSRDGRERLIAGSYVVLRSKLPPEDIMPATVRNILGDELHQLLYGDPPREGGSEKNPKRRI